MCQINGYIGPHRAAPILLEMAKRQSGFFGGYYTGIATVFDGKLYMAKVMGDVDRLEAVTEAANLPGNIGFLHCRSNDGGDDHWAQPFVSNDGQFAYMANGSGDLYKGRSYFRKDMEKMEALGVKFDSMRLDPVGKYAAQGSGKCCHSSETKAHLIRWLMKEKGISAAEAMKEAFVASPSGIVGLSLCTDEPDRLSYARFNHPLTVARTEDEVFLATCAIAFPEDRDYLSMTPLPEASYGSVSLKETVIGRFRPEFPIDRITPKRYHDGRELIEAKLRSDEAPCKVGKLFAASKPVWTEGHMAQKAPLAYEVLYDLWCEGRLNIEKRVEPGAAEGIPLGITTTQFYLSLKD